MSLSFNQKLLLFSVILVAGITLTGYAVYKSNQKRQETAAWVQHTQSVIYESGNVLSLAKDIQTAARGYVITRDSEFLAPFFLAQPAILQNVNHLRKLTSDNPSERLQIDSLEYYIKARIDFANKVIKARNEEGMPAALSLYTVKDGKRYVDHVRQIANDIQKQENLLLQQRQLANDRSSAWLNRVSLALFILMILFTVLFFSAVGTFSRQSQQHSNEIKKRNTDLKQKIDEIADFKALFESAPGLFLILKPNLVIDAVSDEYLLATMTSREKIIGRHLFDVFPDNPDDPAADGVSNLRSSLSTVLETKKSHAMAMQKYDIRRVDGSFEERFWSPLNKPVLNSSGEVVYLIHSVVDQTQRVHHEQEILRATDEIKELYDKAPCGYFSVDANIHIANINQTLLSWLGYVAEDVIGKMKYEDLLSPESREAHLNSFEEVFAQYLNSGYVNDLEFTFKRKDGSFFPVLVNSIAVFDENGNFLKSRSTVFDNTERKKAGEELLKSNALFANLFNYNPAAIAISRLSDARIINVNDSFLSLFGFADKQQVLGKTSADLSLLVDSEQRNLIVRGLASSKVVNTEGQINLLSGEIKWVSLFALKIEVDNQPCMLAVTLDITERKKAEEQLQAVNKELESFSYSVSHDLRAPLRAIHGYAQILFEDYGKKFDAEANRVLRNVMTNAKRMGQLIDDLLSFSRLGRKELVKQNISMKEMVTNICDELAIGQPPLKPVEFIINDLPTVAADNATLKQAWVNLISNSIKYSKLKDKAVIEIGTQTIGNETTFYIKDNGAGFDMRYAKNLFGVFQRLHSDEEFEGTGVGLAIVQRVISRHGGRIWAEGKVNEGATFYFTLSKS